MGQGRAPNPATQHTVTVSAESRRTTRILENNWKHKSLENLEKDIWGEPPKGATPLVEKVHRLRTMPIEKLAPRDIRLLIGQNVGLDYLIPLALDILQDDLFVDTELYEGDLLKSVISVDNRFWDNNKELKVKFDHLRKSWGVED